MVILFKGTDTEMNMAPEALSLCAGLSATKYIKKTIIIQLTTKYPVEKLLIGKKVEERSIKDDIQFFEDTGMDSLTRRAGVTTFNEKHFANAVTPVVNAEQLFDVLNVSKKIESDVEREIIKEPERYEMVIRSAAKFYDNVFVLANGCSKDVISAVLPFIDRTVTCIPQKGKALISASSGNKEYFLVTEYDSDSLYGIHHMSKLYDNKDISVMPYNVELKDAAINKNLLPFIMHNVEPDKSDYNYYLISEMDKFLKKITGNDEYEVDDFRFTKKTVSRFIEEPIMLTGKSINIEEKEKKFMRPSKKLVHVLTDDEMHEDVSNEQPNEILGKSS